MLPVAVTSRAYMPPFTVELATPTLNYVLYRRSSFTLHSRYQAI